MRHGPPLRLFVALYPPPAIAPALLAHLDPLNLPAHRRTSPDQLHLTLVFIGDTQPRDLRSVTESVERSCSGLGPFTLRPTRLITIPDHPATAPPRLVAAETDQPPALMEIQRRLAVRLARARRPGKADSFRPHLTLCRFPEGTRQPESGPWCAELSPESHAFHVEHIALVSSVLTARGSVHQAVGTFPLEG